MTLTSDLFYPFDGTPVLSSSASELTAADEADRFCNHKKVRRAAVRDDFQKPSTKRSLSIDGNKRLNTCIETENDRSYMPSPRLIKSAVVTRSIDGITKTKPSTGGPAKSVKFYYSEMKLPDRLFPPNNSQFIADVSSSIPVNWKKPPEYVAGFFEAVVQFSENTLASAILHPPFTSTSTPSSSPSAQQSHFFVYVAKAFDKTVTYWSRKLDKGCIKDQRKAVQHMLLWYANCKRLEILMTTFYSTNFTPPSSTRTISNTKNRPPLFGSIEFSANTRHIHLNNVAALFNDLSQSGLMKAIRRLRPIKFPG